MIKDMRLRMPYKYYVITFNLINQTINNVHFKSVVQKALLVEARNLFGSVCAKFHTTSKDITKKIPESVALMFYELFNGMLLNGYVSTIVNYICEQIEQQLFITGKYEL